MKKETQQDDKTLNSNNAKQKRIHIETFGCFLDSVFMVSAELLFGINQKIGQKQ
jgi:hypothetical protein